MFHLGCRKIHTIYYRLHLRLSYAPSYIGFGCEYFSRFFFITLDGVLNKIASVLYHRQVVMFSSPHRWCGYNKTI